MRNWVEGIYKMQITAWLLAMWTIHLYGEFMHEYTNVLVIKVGTDSVNATCTTMLGEALVGGRNTG